jgi:hypothetical protein
VVDAGPAESHLPRYRVEVPFHAAANGRLPKLPFELPDGAIVDRLIAAEDRPEAERPETLSTVTKTFSAQGVPRNVERPPAASSDPPRAYRYCIILRAASAEQAVSRAEAAAQDLLAAIAARQMAFEIGAAAKRVIKKLDPPTDPIPDSELPFDTVNISHSDVALLAARFDPSGDRRRRGMIFSSVADAAVDRESLEIDAELYAGHERWDNRIRRAAEVYRLALCSRDEVARFLLSCLVLEVLVAHESVAILSVRFAMKPQREHIVGAVDEALTTAGLGDEDRDRIIGRVRQTEAQGYTASAADYLEGLELSISPENLGWIQRQRGKFVHTGQFDDSQDAALRRNGFVKIVGVALQREMAAAAGRSFDGLDEAVTFSWLEVWAFGDDELSLKPR